MNLYSLRYEFPLGSGNYTERTWKAKDEQEAKRSYGVKNPTLTVEFIEEVVLPVAHTYNSRGQRVIATLSNAPCDAKCWHAEGNVCVCSCKGYNHGIGHAPTE
jgi:hypothetical protein